MTQRILTLLRTSKAKLSIAEIARRVNARRTEVLTQLMDLRRMKAVKSWGCGTMNRRYWTAA